MPVEQAATLLLSRPLARIMHQGEEKGPRSESNLLADKFLNSHRRLLMSVQAVWSEVIDFSPCGAIVFQARDELHSHDAGLLLFRQLGCATWA